MSWTFVLEIEPIGKGRPKFSRQGGGRAYTPMLFHRAWGGKKPIEKGIAVGVNITAVFPRLKKHTAKKYSTSRIPKTTKPDKDNIEKIVLDSMKSILFDDCQVTDGRTRKYWGAVGESAKVIVEVWLVQDHDLIQPSLSTH